MTVLPKQDTAQEIHDLQGHIKDCELCQGASKQFDVLFRQLKSYLGTDAGNK